MVRVLHHILIGLVFACLIAGCTSQQASPLPQEKKFPVEVGEVTVRDIPVYIEAIGNVVAFNQVEVRPQVSGRVIDVYVRGGQDVRAGEVLYQIDPVPYQIAFDKARANLEKDLAQLDYARQRLARYERLLASNFVSKLNIEEYRSNVRTQEAQVGIDESELRLAEVNLAYTQVISPIDGRVSLNPVDVGNLVTANDPNALTVILQITPIYVYFAIPQSQFQDLQQVLAEGRKQFKAILPFGSQQQFDGELVAIDNRVNPQTGTIQLKGVIPNQDKILWPGEFVTVRLFIKTNYQVPVVPLVAVQLGQKGSFVFVLNPQEMTVDIAYVKTGERTDGHIAIEEGLKPGMKVITDGHLNLSSGAKVEIQKGLGQGEAK